MKVADRIAGSLLCGALADAIGSKFENKTAGQTYSLSELSDLSVTDDTQLTLATCEALIESNKIEPEVIARHFLRIYQKEGIRGVGSSTLKALRDLEAGAHWFLAGNRTERSAGNGAAMRIAPIALWPNAEFDDLPFVVRDVCSITHKNDEAYTGALAVSIAIRFGMEGRRLGDLKVGLEENLSDTNVRDALAVLDLVSEISIFEASKITGTSGYVAESVPLALFSAIKSEEIGTLRMIEEIIHCGGDTDTIASIAAQISGAYLGKPRSIENLIEKVREHEYIVSVVSTFMNTPNLQKSNQSDVSIPLRAPRSTP